MLPDSDSKIGQCLMKLRRTVQKVSVFWATLYIQAMPNLAHA